MMDTFRALYKANPITPKKCKRKEAHEIRANKRSELYTSTRNISPSPSPLRKHFSPSPLNPTENEKENFKPIFPSGSEKPEPAKSESPGTKTNEKLNRKKAHLLKFLAWKAEKAKQAEIKEKSKRAPFVVGTRNCVATADRVASNNIKKTSFAPVNHIFRPPASIQSIELKVIDSNSVRLINGIREETYHFLATPNKKTKNLDSGFLTNHKSYKKPITEKTPVANTRVTRMHINAKPVVKTETNITELPSERKANSVFSKPKTMLPPIKRSNFKPSKTSNSSISSAFVAVNGKINIKNEVQLPTLNSKSVLKNITETRTLSKNTLTIVEDGSRRRPLNGIDLPAKTKLLSKGPNCETIKLAQQIDKPTTHTLNSDMKPPAVSKTSRVGLLSKKALATAVPPVKSTKTPQSKVLGNQLNSNDGPPRTRTNTGLLKPKSVLPPIKRSNFKASKKTNSSISNAIKIVTAKGMPLKAKTNGKSIKNALEVMAKNSAQIPETPTDGNHGFTFLNVVTSTKIKSQSSKESSENSLFVEMDQLVSPVDDSVKQNDNNAEKFNFLRYSVVQSDTSKPDDGIETKVSKEVYVTPDKAAGPQTPTTYLSPFVSVSRGKVGIKAEREKRNSVYMSLDKSINEDADTTSKVRHTMATVNYYRKQLKDEIDRLNGQCEEWQQYKDANAQHLEDAGSDMINVTIGQTKLLTTKKLKQFGDLIDRCENGVKGVKSTSKGDGAKPILTEDLEGFWSMVGLQIENVDKRFANLQRWKDNNWKDPDEVPHKLASTNNKIKKVKKTRQGTSAGPNRDLQKILRNAQAAFLRKKTANSGINEDVILTPSKNRQVLIRDRRSRSAAATVITINTPKISRKSAVFDQTTPTADTKVLPHVNGFRKSMNLFKSALLNKQEKVSPAPNTCGTPLSISRKSILKTPGSIRRRKSVIFNSPPLQFTVEDKLENEKPPSDLEKKEEEERTYSLRNRNIKLRDLADIIIPE